MELSLSVINGRFKYLERPVALPGKCACCGAVDKPVVDFGFDLDFYGVVYLCMDCLGEAVQVAGAHIAAGNGAVPLPAIDYEGLNEYFRAVSQSLDRVTAILPPAYFDLPVDEADGEDAGEAESEHADPIPDASSDGNSEPELVVIEGPDDVPSVKRDPISF